MNWLRALTATQQVGLLFVILFGALLLTTISAYFLALRERTPEKEASHQRFKRDLRAVWIGSTLFWLAWMSGAPGATLLSALCSFLALREYITLLHTRRSDHRSLLLAFFVILPLQYLIVGTRSFDLFTVFIPVYTFLALPIISALADDPHRFLERNAKIQWGLMVCVYGLSHAPALLLLDFPRYTGRGAFLLFFLVMVASCAQIAQEAASNRLRRRPVARRISRSFSLRGWSVGVAAAATVGLALFWITPFNVWQAGLIGAVAGGSGTLGGLVMQALKRDAGVQSWGNQSSITGAIGLLDRIAALCFAAPVFFHGVRWYFVLHP